MIHGVRRRKRGDWWQHAEGIAGEENHVSRMAGNARNFGILDELNWIRAACVLGNTRVGVVDASIVIEHDVLKYRAEAQRLENIRFAFWREIDRLGVAAAFDVEDSVVAPDMLVITDEMTLRIG